MATRNTARVAESFTLRARFRRGGELFDPYEVARVVLADSTLTEVERILDVTRISAGVYEVAIPSLQEAGVYTDYWYYTAEEDGAEASLALSVTVAPVVLTAADAAVTVEADIGEENLCEVTARFFTASGAGLPGVRVVFQPSYLSQQVQDAGIVAEGDVVGVSDADGELSMFLVRGVRGWVSCSDLFLVREVVIPDEDTVALVDLEALAPDLLTARTPPALYPLTRRS